VKPIQTVRPILLKHTSVVVSSQLKALSRKKLFNSPTVEIKSDTENSLIPTSPNRVKLPGKITFAVSERSKAISPD
jgi:hypothetical protein